MSNGPRVTLNDIEANIVSEHYFTAAQGTLGAMAAVEEAEVLHIPKGAFSAPKKPLDLLTFCVLILRNGFTVTGESACVSPENFDAEKGQQIARQKAVEKIWPLMGYELRHRLVADKAEQPGSGVEGSANE